MEKVCEKFSLYDFIGYLFPGLIITITTFLFMLYSDIHLTLIYIDFSSIQGGIIILFLSYIIGHVIQTISNSYESSINKSLYGKYKYPSYHILTTEKNKKSVKNFLDNSANLFNEDIQGNEQNLFRNAHKFLKVEKIGGDYDTFNYLYSYYRGMTVAFLIGFFALIISAAILSLKCFHNYISQADYFNSISLVIVNILIFFICYYCHKKRFIRFGKYFANEVITCFNVYYFTKINNR